MVNEIKVGEAVFGLANQNLTTLVEPLAEGQRHHHRIATHRLHRLRDRPERELPAPPGPVGLERHATTSRTSYTARAVTTCALAAEFLHRHQIQANCRQCSGDMRANGGPSAWARAATVLFPGSVQRRYLEPGGHLTSRDDLQHRRRRLQRAPLLEEVRGLGARRLAAVVEPDAQPRPCGTTSRSDAFANDVAVPPFQEAGRPNDTTNFQPRVGFAYQMNDKTVVRGGIGVVLRRCHRAPTSRSPPVTRRSSSSHLPMTAGPTSRRIPTNGRPLPTYEQAQAALCSGNPAVFNAWKATNYAGTAPCLTRDLQEFVAPPEFVHLPKTFQTSVGVQRQIGSVIRGRRPTTSTARARRKRTSSTTST